MYLKREKQSTRSYLIKALLLPPPLKTIPSIFPYPRWRGMICSTRITTSVIINNTILLICWISIGLPMELALRAWIVVCSQWRQMGIIDNVKPSGKLTLCRVHCVIIYPWFPWLLLDILLLPLWTTITHLFVYILVYPVFVWVQPWHCNFYYENCSGTGFYFWKILILHEGFVKKHKN